MITGYSHIANMRCPNCDQLQSVFQMSRTDEARATIWGALPFLACRKCASKLRIADYSRTLTFWLSLPVFIGSGVFGLVVFNYVGLYGRADQAGPNFVGFVLIMALFVVPAQLLLMRRLKVEVVP